MKNAQRQGNHAVVINAHFDAEGAGLLKLQGLEMEDHVPSQEIDFWWNGDVELHRRERIDHVNAVSVDDADGQIMLAFIHRTEANPQGQNAVLMHDGEGAGANRVKRAENAQFAVVIVGRVTESCYLNIHRGRQDSGYRWNASEVRAKLFRPQMSRCHVFGTPKSDPTSCHSHA